MTNVFRLKDILELQRTTMNLQNLLTIHEYLKLQSFIQQIRSIHNTQPINITSTPA